MVDAKSIAQHVVELMGSGAPQQFGLLLMMEPKDSPLAALDIQALESILETRPDLFSSVDSPSPLNRFSFGGRYWVLVGSHFDPARIVDYLESRPRASKHQIAEDLRLDRSFVASVLRSFSRTFERSPEGLWTLRRTKPERRQTATKYYENLVPELSHDSDSSVRLGQRPPLPMPNARPRTQTDAGTYGRRRCGHAGRCVCE